MKPISQEDAQQWKKAAERQRDELEKVWCDLRQAGIIAWNGKTHDDLCGCIARLVKQRDDALDALRTEMREWKDNGWPKQPHADGCHCGRCRASRVLRDHP